MISVTFQNDVNTVTSADSLYQWDVGQSLQIKGLSLTVAPKVHFATKLDDTAYVVQSQMSSGTITVGIPDKVLTHGYPVIAYVYLEQGVDKRTIKSITIPLIKRPKPSEWRETNAESIIEAVNFYEQLATDLNNEMQELRELLESIDASVGGQLTTAVPIKRGGTGATTVEGALANLGIDASHFTNEDNPHGTTAEQVGAIPIIDAYGTSWDMNSVLTTSGGHVAIYDTNSTTRNTPYNKGLSMVQNAKILSCGNNSKNGFQIAFLSGDMPMMRTYTNGVIGVWTKGYVALDSGELDLYKLIITSGGSISSDGENKLAVTANTSSGGYRRLQVDGGANVDREHCLKLEEFDGVSSAGFVYGKVYHTWNITANTYDVTASISPLANDCYYDVYK